ncbi:MAG: hypothetical protein K6F72_00125 [Bacteroidales bacterium]|nr:hypothetical protein [Bacteroidales bacterium]
MYIIHSGTDKLPVVRCTDHKRQHWCIVWDCTEEPNEEEQGKNYAYKCVDYDHKPTMDEVKADIMADHDHENYDWNEYERLLN